MNFRSLSLTAVTMLAALTVSIASVATVSATPINHTVNCVTVSGKPYLGDPGASGKNKNAVCQFWFDQELPHADGSILVLKTTAGRAAAYSLGTFRPQTPSAGTAYIPTDHRGETVDCVTVSGKPYLGDPGASGKNKNAVCQFWFDQELPHADGSILVLKTTAGRTSVYSVKKLHLSTPSRGTVHIPWGPAPK